LNLKALVGQRELAIADAEQPTLGIQGGDLEHQGTAGHHAVPVGQVAADDKPSHVLGIGTVHAREIRQKGLVDDDTRLALVAHRQGVSRGSQHVPVAAGLEHACIGIKPHLVGSDIQPIHGQFEFTVAAVDEASSLPVDRGYV